MENLVNCAVLAGKSASLRIVLSSRLSHTENGAVHSGNPSFFSLPSDIMMASSRHSKEMTEELTNLMGNLCCASEHSIQFSGSFSYAVKMHSLTESVWGPFTIKQDLF
jgi:hypothetical protein